MSAARLFAGLLRLYPARTRRTFGAGIAAAWQADLVLARRRGRAAALTFWIATVFDAARFGTAERWAAAAPRTLLSIDWRDAQRSLRSTPLVTGFCILALALGIGGVTALFSVLDSLAFKPLPVRDPSSLVLLDDGSWTNPIWEAVRARRAAFAAGAFAWASRSFDASDTAVAEPIQGLWASGEMFDVLGVPAIIGRTFTVADDVRGGGPDGAVAVISYAMWQRRFGGAPDVIGRRLSIEHTPFTIVGVTPRGFFGPEVGRSFDVAIPIGAEALVQHSGSALDDRSWWWLEIMVRLAPGETAAQATGRLRQLQPQIRDATLPPFSRDAQRDYLSEPLTFVAAASARSALRRSYERPLTALLAIVAIVLLIACASIANMLIARAAARRRELTIRLALGASRFRLAKQLLAESLLMSAVGAAAGVAIARWGSRLVTAQLSTYVNVIDLDLALDWRVLTFCAGIATLAALLAGVAPVLSLGRLGASEALRESTRGAGGDAALAGRYAGVVVQIALSLALIVAAGLFTRSFAQLSGRDAGFDRRGVLLVDADVSRGASRGPARDDAYRRFAAAAAAVPGVRSAAASFNTPMSRAGWNTMVDVPADSALSRRERMAWVNAVSPGWFGTLGLQFVAGRDFDAGDGRGAPHVAIVNRAFARRFLVGGDAVGRSFRTREPEPDNPTPHYDVVGVVEDAVYRSLREPMEPTVYLPLTQTDPPGSRVISVRLATALSPEMVRAVGAAIVQEEPKVVLSFHTLDDQVNASLTQERLIAALSIFFGALGLLLAFIGLYGLTASWVTSRRAEIGIRMALGASAAGVVRLVLTRVALLVAAGLVAGGILSAWAATFVTAFLYGLAPRDPLTFAGAVLALVAVATIAAWLPARKAARIDPIVALRT